MKPVHVLHCTLFLKMGGLESIIMDIAKNMDRSIFKISILCLGSYDESYKSIMDDIGVPIYHIKRNGRFDRSFFKRIVSLIKTIKADVFHAHSGCFFNTAICAKISGVKTYVYTEHGLPLYDSGLPMNTGFKTRLEDKFAAWVSDRIFAVSDEIRMDMATRFPRSMNKVRIVTNGVDTDRFKLDKDDTLKADLKKRFAIPADYKVIGSVGRLVHIKNYESLIRAFSKLIKNYDKKLHLILIGDGVERLRLENIARENNVFPFVTFAGVQYNIQNILPAFNVFVLPSRTEGTSISLLEAQACGVPAVVSLVGGNPNIIKHGLNGFLFKPDDCDAMAQCIKEILSDETLSARMSMTASEMVQNRFSVRTMVKEYENSYLELLKKNEKPGSGS